MANWRRKQERREEIRKLNAEGAKVYHDGKHIQNMPVKYNGSMDVVTGGMDIMMLRWQIKLRMISWIRFTTSVQTQIYKGE